MHKIELLDIIISGLRLFSFREMISLLCLEEETNKFNYETYKIHLEIVWLESTQIGYGCSAYQEMLSLLFLDVLIEK